IEKVLRETFPEWKSAAPYAPVLSEPRQVAPKRMFVDTPDKENAVFRARINIVMRDDHPDYPALALANYIFGGGSGLSSRLMDRVRQRDGISYSAASYVSVNARDSAGHFQITGLVAPQNAERFERAIKEELDRMLKEGFTAQEIEDGKNGYLQERTLSRAQDGRVAAGWILHLDADRTFAFSGAIDEQVRRLTPDQVLAAVRRHLDVGKMTTVVAGDAGKGAK
ncbi:MAG TPA: insulinase family protein, partial [Burkholderiaceae bacterium]|nr:insulinase family protein [Burkholderiaceae bacterium]